MYIHLYIYKYNHDQLDQHKYSLSNNYLMYNIKTGQHNGSWDTPTSLDYCHLSCVSAGNLWVPGTHPL